MTKRERIAKLEKTAARIASTQEVDDAIRAIYARDHVVTPDAVIEAARDPSSPLHSRFEWDIEKAALEHWRDTARELIRSVKVIVKTEHISFKPRTNPPPEFIRDPAYGPKVQGYSRVSDIATDADRALDAIMVEIDRAEGSVQRAIAIGRELGLDMAIRGVASALEAAREVVSKSARAS